MSDEKIEFHFTGEGITPSAIRAGDLAHILEAIEDVLAAVVIAQHSTLSKDNLLIGLSNITTGSLSLQFSTQLPEVVIPAFQEVSHAIRAGKPSLLPRESYPAFDKIIQFMKKNQAQVDLILVNGKPETLATITPDLEIPKPSYITGETTIYGQIVRVGGAEPKVEIRIISGKVLYCPFEITLAPELGALLYKNVGLKGDAKWDTATYEISEFKALAVTDYRETSITDAFAELRSVAGDYYSDLDDVTQYVSELRRG